MPTPRASLRRERYDPKDEVLLRQLKKDNPKASWESIRRKFNSNVPASRQRTSNGVKGKWKGMENWKRGIILLGELKHTHPQMEPSELLAVYNESVADHRRIQFTVLETMLKELEQNHKKNDEKAASNALEITEHGERSTSSRWNSLSTPSSPICSEFSFSDDELGGYLDPESWLHSLCDFLNQNTNGADIHDDNNTTGAFESTKTQRTSLSSVRSTPVGSTDGARS